MSCEQLVSELHESQNYELEVDARPYQVEVLLLENTNTYLHVMVAVSDDSFRGSFLPLTQTFLCEKASPGTHAAAR